jgi:hypothetical protein
MTSKLKDLKEEKKKRGIEGDHGQIYGRLGN